MIVLLCKFFTGEYTPKIDALTIIILSIKQCKIQQQLKNKSMESECSLNNKSPLELRADHFTYHALFCTERSV